MPKTSQVVKEVQVPRRRRSPRGASGSGDTEVELTYKRNPKTKWKNKRLRRKIFSEITLTDKIAKKRKKRITNKRQVLHKTDGTGVFKNGHKKGSSKYQNQKCKSRY